MEKWRPIVGYEECYEVSNIGNVRSLDRVTLNTNRPVKGRDIKVATEKNGYVRFPTNKDGVKGRMSVHRAVWFAFNPDCIDSENMVVHHKNNNPSDNRLENLDYISQRENSHTHCASTSKYKGVHFYKRYGKWVAKVNIKDKRKFLGYFENEDDAGLAYQKALVENNLL